MAAAFETQPVLYVIGLLVALLTAFYMGRWYFLVWRGEYRGAAATGVAHPHEADAITLIPLGILAAGATLIGGLSKVIEFMNPANTLAAQTFMILFIIIFIQFRPRGIIPQRGRAAEA